MSVCYVNLFARVQSGVKTWTLLMFSLSKVIRLNKAILGLLRFEFEVFLTGSCFEYLVHSW